MISNNDQVSMSSPQSEEYQLQSTITISPAVSLESTIDESIFIDSIDSVSQQKITVIANRIQNKLMTDKQQYCVIPSESSDKFWKVFGYPTFIVKQGDINTTRRIPNFLSCKKCFKTFKYSRISGTAQFNNHICVKNALVFDSSSPSPTRTNYKQQILPSGFTASRKLPTTEVEKVNSYMVNWIVGDLRPFSIVEDGGLKGLAQLLINLGSSHGSVDINEVFCRERTISRRVVEIADIARNDVATILSEPLMMKSVTICPDMWTDKFRNVLYLGATAIFVDSDYSYHQLELFCRPYTQADKSASSTILALKEELKDFGIHDLTEVQWISDRGSNFMGAFREYNPIYCFAHRLNNILKELFHQNIRKKDASQNQTTTERNEICESNYKLTSTQRTAVEKIDEYSTESEDEDSVIVIIVQVPSSASLKARKLLATIDECKKLVKYAKKTTINSEVRQKTGKSLKQSVIVRWLSLYECLESVNQNYEELKNVLMKRKQQHWMKNIDQRSIHELLLILKPFKHMMTIIQGGQYPTLYMVLLCAMKLKKTFQSYKSIIEFNQQQNENVIFQYVEEDDEPSALCSQNEKEQCFIYIREEMYRLQQQLNDDQLEEPEPPSKRIKVVNPLFKDLEDSFVSNPCTDINRELDDFQSSQGSCEFIYHAPQMYQPRPPDELQRYLQLSIPGEAIDRDPMKFWSNIDTRRNFPLLSIVARRIHAIPATSASVERLFSSAGLTVTQRRTRLSPSQIDNILFIRSYEKFKNK
ncbi:unnamed protein product, partial [Rotaria sp. Silwood2]